VLGSQFFNKANEKGYNHPMIALKYGPSMNIGYYSKESLTTHTELLSEFKNRDYTPQGLHRAKAVAVTSEDAISNAYKTDQTIYQNHGPEILGTTDYYNTGTPRKIEYYTGLDLFKIKANYDLPFDWPNWIIKP